MRPDQIVAFIKEKPTSEGCRLLLNLFPQCFTVMKSAIDAKAPAPKPQPAPSRQAHDPDHNPHPLDTVKPDHQGEGPMPGFKKVKSVKPHEDPAGQGRSYDILVPRQGTGKIQIDGRDATPAEIADATAQMNREAEEQLRQMANGTYKWLDRNVSPDKTHPTFPKGDGSSEDPA